MSGTIPSPSPTTPTDPEAAWPPRFRSKFIALASLVLLAVAVAAALLLKGVMVPEEPTTRHIMAYVFAVAGVLMLLVGALFGLVEAKRPPEVHVITQPARAAVAGEAAVPQIIQAVVTVAGAISKEKRSTAAWSLGFGLLLMAGVASGLVSFSVGDGDDGANEEPTEEASEESTED